MFGVSWKSDFWATAGARGTMNQFRTVLSLESLDGRVMMDATPVQPNTPPQNTTPASIPPYPETIRPPGTLPPVSPPANEVAPQPHNPDPIERELERQEGLLHDIMSQLQYFQTDLDNNLHYLEDAKKSGDEKYQSDLKEAIAAILLEKAGLVQFFNDTMYEYHEFGEYFGYDPLADIYKFNPNNPGNKTVY